MNKILWADDEIDLLTPHILFLRNKGYDLVTATNGRDALEILDEADGAFDLVFLDEMMPGLTGLETLQRIKETWPTLPVVMITKSEEEDIMDQAIGSTIADYLIKPVSPTQMLMSIKKHIHGREIKQQRQTTSYQQEFGRLSMQIADARTFTDWVEVYRKLVFWEMELADAPDASLSDMLLLQKQDANTAWAKYVRTHYADWMIDRVARANGQRPAHSLSPDDTPLMSPDLFRTDIFPRLDNGERIFLIVIDNFRLDQWRAIQPYLAQWYSVQEEIYCSILPTATQYARNAIFSGLLPRQIASMYPELWVDEDTEEGKNLNEEPLIRTQIERYRKAYSFSYHKINETSYGDYVVGKLKSLSRHPLNIVVMNFIDMLSHARTESKAIRELANSEAAYRALTRSWFEHSSAAELFRRIAEMGYKVVLTTDHGSIRTSSPVRIVGDKEVNTNIRYKFGKNLSCQSKQIYEIKNPAEMGLPAPHLSTSYMFCTGRDFFAYPNNYNYYAQYFKDTFQHGGISLEEMLIPLITLTPKA